MMSEPMNRSAGAPRPLFENEVVSIKLRSTPNANTPNEYRKIRTSGCEKPTLERSLTNDHRHAGTKKMLIKKNER